MLYTLPKFTLPASNNISQLRWDMAFLEPSEFQKKYSITDSEYDNLAKDKDL